VAQPVRGDAADPSPAEAEEDVPDMNSVRTRAEAGKPAAQTQWADLCLASADFTNAVFWYRKAAEQDHVPAKLSLAACLMTGRGTSKNPAEAAQLLRQAADLIESGSGSGPMAPVAAPPTTNAVLQASSKALWITKQGMVASTNTAAPAAQTLPAPRPSEAAQTSLTRVQRADELLAVEPVLQEPRVVFRPAREPGLSPLAPSLSRADGVERARRAAEGGGSRAESTNTLPGNSHSEAR